MFVTNCNKLSLKAVLLKLESIKYLYFLLKQHLYSLRLILEIKEICNHK